MNRILPLLFLLCAGLLAGCSSGLVRNQPPLVQISAWEIDGEQLKVDLHLRNVNEEPMPLSAVSLTIRLGDVLLAEHRQSLASSVATSGFESVPLRLSPTTEGLAELKSLEDGSRKSLTYTLKGSVVTTGNRELPFTRDGHIYTVPGRPGQFR